MLIPRRFAALAQIADEDPRAPGIRIERIGKDRAVAVATDGWRLIGCTFTPADDKDYPTFGLGPAPTTPDAFTVSGEALARAARAHPGKKTLPILDHVLVGVREGRPMAASTDTVAPMVVPDAASQHATSEDPLGVKAFPRWREVVKDHDARKSSTATMGLALLIDTLQRMQKLVGSAPRAGMGWGPEVKITIEDPSKPITLTVTRDGAQAWAIQMSRGDDREPGWGNPARIERGAEPAAAPKAKEKK